MKKDYCYSAGFDYHTEKLFRRAEFLGQGNNGIVFKLPENKVIKIFAEEKVCKDESYILLRAKKSDFFPKVYSVGKLYIVRDMVNGVRLDKYIKRYGINERISKNIFYVLKDFERLKFTKVDSRCKDLYVCSGQKIMIIDPKKNYSKIVPYPRHLMKGLNKLSVLDAFILNIASIDKNLAADWKERFSEYSKKKVTDYIIK